MMKPKLLLHICCAPDEAYVVNLLKEDYELHCFFCNPNIFPSEEFDLRLKEAKNASEMYGVPFTYDEWDLPSWSTAVKGLENTAEGGERCRSCFLLRLRRTAETCRKMGWNSFTSVMSVSPHKNIKMLNETGKIAANEFGVAYEPFDFKKKDGFRKSIVLSRELGLYRQDYCGCSLSLSERDQRELKRTQNL